MQERLSAGSPNGAANTDSGASQGVVQNQPFYALRRDDDDEVRSECECTVDRENLARLGAVRLLKSDFESPTW